MFSLKPPTNQFHSLISSPCTCHLSIFISLPLWLLRILFVATKILVVSVTYRVHESIDMHSAPRDKKRRDVHRRCKEKVRSWHMCLEITTLGTMAHGLPGYWCPSIGGTAWAMAAVAIKAGPCMNYTKRSFSSNSNIYTSCPKHNRLEEETKLWGFFFLQMLVQEIN